MLVAGEEEGLLHALAVHGLDALVGVLLDHGEEVAEEAALEGVETLVGHDDRRDGAGAVLVGVDWIVLEAPLEGA